MATFMIVIALLFAIIINYPTIKQYRRKLHMAKMNIVIHWNDKITNGTILEYVDNDGKIYQGYALMEWTDKHTAKDRLELIQAVTEARGDKHLYGAIIDGVRYAPILPVDRTYYVKAA